MRNENDCSWFVFVLQIFVLIYLSQVPTSAFTEARTQREKSKAKYTRRNGSRGAYTRAAPDGAAFFLQAPPPLSSSVCVFFTLKIVYFFYLFVSLKRGAARQPPLPTPPKAAHSFLRSCFFSSGEWIRYFKEPRDKGGQRARTRNTKNFFFQGEKRDPRRSMRKGDQFASLFKTRANESVEKRFAALSYI